MPALHNQQQQQQQEQQQQQHQHQQEQPRKPPRATLSSTILKTKFKSSSLDHEIFLTNRRNKMANTNNTKLQQLHVMHLMSPTTSLKVPASTITAAAAAASTTTMPTGAAVTSMSMLNSGNITRATSTTSLASSARTGTHYQEYKLEIINQGKCLCGQYIRARLRRAGVLNRKVIQRLRTILEPSSDVVYEVFPALNTMGEELERMHPRVYTNISRQLSRTPFGELVDSETAPMLLNLVAKDLFRSSITWGKIISIFAVCGGFAIDCVRQGHYDYLQFLVDGLTEIIEDDLVYWLIDNGGWLGLQQHIRPRVGQITFLGWLTLFVTITSGFYIISNICKHIGCHLYALLF